MTNNGNEYTKNQIREFIENAIKKARNPDPREKMRKLRRIKSAKIAQKYGF